MQHTLNPKDAYWQSLINKRDDLKRQISAIDLELSQRPTEPRMFEPLSDDSVAEYRRLYATGEQTMTGLAKLAGVHKSTMSRLIRFKSHKDSA